MPPVVECAVEEVVAAVVVVFGWELFLFVTRSKISRSLSDRDEEE